MRRMASALGMVIAVLLGSVIAAPAAIAETERRQDARNEAPSAIDISEVTYTHGLRQVRVVATIPDLGRRGSAALSISRFTIFEAGYVVEIKKRRGHPARTKLYYFNHFDLEPRRCSDVEGQWGADHVRLKVARHCLDGHRREQVFAQFGIQRGEAIDRAPAVRRLQRG